MDDPRKPGQEPPAGDPEWGFGDDEPFDDVLPLHTGEVEILDEDVFSEQYQEPDQPAEISTSVGEEPLPPAEEELVEEEPLFDDGLSFDEEDVVSEEEAFGEEGEDDLAVVDDLDSAFEDDGAFEEVVSEDAYVSEDAVYEEELVAEEEAVGEEELSSAEPEGSLDDLRSELEDEPWGAEEDLGQAPDVTDPAFEPEPDEVSWRTRHPLFKEESHKLAMARQWEDLADLSRQALQEATWARKGADRITLLLDLARLYRDRLSDSEHAEEIFAMLADEDPTHSEALAFLAEQYRSTENWERLYRLYLGAVAPTWDPNERLERTREAALIAIDRLGQADLAIDAWEQLWNLKDAREESERELLHLYRSGAHWTRLASFLEAKMEGIEGGQLSLAMREVAEVYLSGVGDRKKALGILNEILEQRPGDPVTLLTLAAVYSQEGEWEALNGLSNRTLEGVSTDVTLEFLRLIADAFWNAGEFDSAHALYRRVLDQNPDDAQALTSVEEYLAQTDRHDELVTFLEDRVARASHEDAQLELLARMARIAQTNLGNPSQAASLWERCVALRPDRAEYHEALAALYDSLGDLEGVARALEGQLATRRDPSGRIELLRTLGEHYAERMEDDERSERCWNEVLALSPEDYGARQQLLSIRRRRGDYEGLNAALEREMALTPDPDWRLELSRQAARNLDENFQDQHRSVAAWQRVLDLAPTDPEALTALEKLYAGEEHRASLVFTLARQIEAAQEPSARIELLRRLGEVLRQGDQARAAATTEEWVLRLDPAEGMALAELDQYYGAREELGKVLGVLENGSAWTEEIGARARLLERAAERSPQGLAGRYFWLRRLLGLRGDEEEVLGALREAAEAADLWGPLGDVFGLLSVCAADPTARRGYRRELARLLEERLDEKGRAYLELQSLLLDAAEAEEQVAELGRLAQDTGRQEDYHAVLGAVALATEDLDARKDTLRVRARLLAEGLESPARAFEAYRALVTLDPSDGESLAQMETLAKTASLWPALDEVYAELWDRSDPEARLALCDKRVALHRDHLEDAAGAFDLLLLKFRLSPQSPGIEDALNEAAEPLGQWEYLLPVLEAQARADTGAQRGEALLRLARQYETQLEDPQHAFDLTAESLLAAPLSDDALQELARLAEAVDGWARQAATLRAAAARCEQQDRRITLYETAADIYWKHELGEQAAVMDRHILSLQPNHRDGLEALIAWHRERQEWDVLRDLLVKRIDILEEGARVDAWLEVAHISEEQLQQPEQALLAYTEVLALDPENDGAMQGFSALESAFTEPTQHVRKMRAELGRAEPERAVEIRLALAKLLEEELDDVAGAKEVLADQVAIDGPDGAPYDELYRLHESSEDWGALADLLEKRAGFLEEDEAQQLALLQRAIDLRHEHLAGQEPDRLETLYREVLKRRPDDEIILGRLVEQLRAAARWADMADLLRQVSERMDRPEDRARTQRELARVLHHGLEQADEARTVYESLLEPEPGDESAACALASFAVDQEAWESYIENRERQTRHLPARLSGLVYCHLAEVADEKGLPASQVSLFYRKARSLDSENQVAMEGLRAIGRRLKNWREVAALLPDDDERALSFPERAERLRLRGDSDLDLDAAQALDWYLRAVATWPDDQEAWAGVSKAATALDDRDLADAASARRLLAFERCVPPTTERLQDHVSLITETAQQLMAAGEVDRARPLLRHAHELMPDFVPAALSVAEEQLEGAEPEMALHIVSGLLENQADALVETDRIRALECKARAATAIGSTSLALDALRAVITLDRLNVQALRAIADLLGQEGRAIEAIQHYLRVLLVEEDDQRRGEVYRQMGSLWEDAIGNTYEGAACYDRAMAAGLDDPDLLRRALKHLVRHQERDKALAVVDALLPVTEDPAQMADLWVAQGTVFLQGDEDLEKASEAFDMALSYMPGYGPALMGLADVLERKEDWAQLLQILEASLELQPPEDQAASLRRMARLYQEKLEDPASAETFLRKSVEMEPTREALETLRAIYEADPARNPEAQVEVLSGLVRFGPPYLNMLVQVGEIAFERGQERWGWALHAPMANVRSTSSDVKTRLRSLRKTYDKAEPPVVSAEDYAAHVRHPDVVPGLNDAIAAVRAALGPLGLHEQDAAGAEASYKLSPNAGLGKTCHLVTESLGLPASLAFRADGIARSFLVVDSDEQPMVMYLTEFLRQFVRAESSFLFGYTLEWLRPGQVTLASLEAAAQEGLVAAVLEVAGLVDAVSEPASELADRIREQVDETTRESWSETLASLQGVAPEAALARHVAGIQATSMRSGLLMAGDTLSAMRAYGRITEAFENPQGKTLDDLDEIVAANTALVDLIAFAASEPFGRILTQ